MTYWRLIILAGLLFFADTGDVKGAFWHDEYAHDDAFNSSSYSGGNGGAGRFLKLVIVLCFSIASYFYVSFAFDRWRERRLAHKPAPKLEGPLDVVFRIFGYAVVAILAVFPLHLLLEYILSIRLEPEHIFWLSAPVFITVVGLNHTGGHPGKSLPEHDDRGGTNSNSKKQRIGFVDAAAIAVVGLLVLTIIAISQPPTSKSPSNAKPDRQTWMGDQFQMTARTISEVQAALKWLNYYFGAVDGIVGPETMNAIRLFESDAGMAVTGTVSERLVTRLDASVRQAAGTANADTGIQPVPGIRCVRKAVMRDADYIACGLAPPN